MFFCAYKKVVFERMHKLVAAMLLVSFVLIQIGFLFDFDFVPEVQAAEVNIDDDVSRSTVEHTILGSALVFISDTDGYKFFVDRNGRCVYRKTTDGGDTWAAAIEVDSQNDCQHPTVWYDRWTPGDTGDYIHITMADPGSDQVWYNRLDTTTDTRLLGANPVSVSAEQPESITIGAAANKQSITKGTDGTLYIAVNDGAGSFVVECTTNCDIQTNWVETGVSPMDLANDFPLLMPLSGGDIMLIVRDISANDIEYQTWNNTNWSGSWITIDANAPENNTYDVGMDAVLGNNTDEIFLVYTAQNNVLGGGDDDIRTAVFSGGTWTNMTDAVTDDAKGIQQVAIGLDTNSNDIYVGYSAQATPGVNTTSNTYWKSSTDGMSTWGAEQGPVNTTSGNIYGIDINKAAAERIYMTWYEAAVDDIFGDTVADISPATFASESGSQVTELRASTTNNYLGGTFVIQEFSTARNVTEVTITESGTIDGSTGLDNITLRYDLDTTAPYDCASESYSGAEAQFGVSDTSGFSGADGVSTFTDSVSINTTQAMCVYVAFDITNQASDLSTIDISIIDPSTDILVSGGETVIPNTPLDLTGVTSVVNSELTQTHYHWRNDDGIEVSATSRTGGAEDTPLTAVQQGTPLRLRVGVSNEGSTSTLPTNLQLEYALNVSTCDAATGWTAVNAVDDDWNMFDSTFLTDGDDTTDILVAVGGVSNENTVFLTPNGGIKDTSDQLGSLTFLPTNWTEAEFAIIASTSAAEGNTYCFRLSNSGEELPSYTTFPRATVAADVVVSALGAQVATGTIPTTDLYFGGTFVFTESTSAHNVESITITESGTVDATSGLSDISLFYDIDTSLPYDCASESYSGTEAQFGIASSSFSGPDGVAQFTDSVGISTTATLCIYPIATITTDANNGETVDISISSGSDDVTVSGGGSVSPSTPIDITSSTTLSGAIITQVHYHWRNDDGGETDATSATAGTEDTPVPDFSQSSAIRLRVGLSNEGETDSVEHRYGLEFGIKVTTCDAIVVWSDVDGGGVSWAMYDSPNLTNGETTTNVDVVDGGVSDENVSFLTSNGGVRDTESFTASTTIASNEYVDLEYSIETTAETPYETDFCFRVTRDGEPLLQYDIYPEITIEPKRDFKIQRGGNIVSGTGLTLTAGIDYDAPASANSAFVRITGSHHTGAGRDGSGGSPGGNQGARDYTAYISNPENLLTNFTIARDIGSINNTYVTWEIVEYIGPAGGDNEIFVRDQGVASYTNNQTVTTGSTVSGVLDDSDIVVFVTGQNHVTNNRGEAFSHQSSSEWLDGTDTPQFTRGAAGGNAGNVSYAVVEFAGLNWNIQRIQHVYSTTTVETESITAVNSLSRTFLHTQKTYTGSTGLDDFGHEVWLSSIGAVSFQLTETADLTRDHTATVWIIENTQNTTGEMVVQRSSGSTTGGSEPQVISVAIPVALNGTNNSSIFLMTRHSQTGNNFPRAIAGAEITTPTNYNLWRSDTGGILFYRTEVVQWPAADLAVRQNYYRLYTDNDALTPSDPWPAGAADLGENTPLGALDEPMADSDNIRIRMTARAFNATLPAGFLDLKLQYGLRVTTCSAIDTWNDVGAPGSGAIWRGYNAGGVTDGVSVSGNPPTGGEVLISVSDRSGRYVESNPSPANEYGVLESEDVEYDWNIELNGAAQRSTYCFRMVKSDDEELDGYFHYPQIRTEGFTPVVDEWRFYDDETNETPVTPLATEKSAPIEILLDEALKLRVTVDETKNLSQANARFKLQFAQEPDFSDATDVVSTTTCAATSEWCFFDGAGIDHDLIENAVLSGSDPCVSGIGAGCGVHVESSDYLNGFTHGAGESKEYEFTIQYKNDEIKYGRVYYFRLYDTASDEVVLATTTYPSLVTEATRLIFSVGGVGSGVSTAGIVTDATSTATAVNFGSLPVGSEVLMAQSISVDTNGTEGYQIFKVADQQLQSSLSNEISPITSSNASPAGWATACTGGALSCFGYHTTDATLENGSTRFAPTDSYAALNTTLEEVMYSSVPSDDTENIIYRILVNQQQPAGLYETGITYIAVPVF